MLHTALIVLHAGAGLACFAGGRACIALRPPGSRRLRVYAGSLLAMLAFVAAAVEVSWADLDVTSRRLLRPVRPRDVHAWRAYRAGIDQFVDVTRPAEGIIEELSRLRRERGLPEQLRVYLSWQRGHTWWGTCQAMTLFP